MCNRLHKKSKNKFRRIKDEGVGWKLFNKRYRDDYCPVCRYGYELKIGETITWDIVKDGDGFCFFLKKADAVKAVKTSWLSPLVVVCKISYSGGLGTFEETGDLSWPPGIRFAIAKKFTILKETKEKR